MILEGKKDGWLRLPVNTLPAWAAFNNVQFNGIKVDAIPGLEDRGSTVVAKRHLSGGQEAPLMTVPKDLILSLERVQEHAKTDADFRTILEALGEFGKVGLDVILCACLVLCSTFPQFIVPSSLFQCLCRRSTMSTYMHDSPYLALPCHFAVSITSMPP